MPALRHNRDYELEEYVNKRVLSCLEDIYFTMKRKRVEIGDFQFLFDVRGNVFVTDPLNIYTGIRLSNNESAAIIANTINLCRKQCRFKTRLTSLDFNIADGYTDETV